jgi:hypothetical protein
MTIAIDEKFFYGMNASSYTCSKANALAHLHAVSQGCVVVVIIAEDKQPKSCRYVGK